MRLPTLKLRTVPRNNTPIRRQMRSADDGSQPAIRPAGFIQSLNSISQRRVLARGIEPAIREPGLSSERARDRLCRERMRRLTCVPGGEFKMPILQRWLDGVARLRDDIDVVGAAAAEKVSGAENRVVASLLAIVLPTLATVLPTTVLPA
ncbi:hypothetical protein ASPZODRAFT_166753 [Penicilliopsis zonata CBS 506.65]|uniref:Uncharacterized protein n=1 Tax=Penicilliopsis zonata CBS 506.65 TaxID=1073090 RepID=A0A1L9SH43_9EURO|nr:hypothetical protein ASPZODRAFT_166753 [Penicilliopsis zonata CBS 506.65]OJJ46512.1 hypothetical protein ASPZODRAFT_166753 [Penicilliopsis zonata CBS 506.65]